MNYKFVSFSFLNSLIKKKNINVNDKLELISLILRLNILYSIQKAGSGHLGSSLSALDIFICCAEYLKNRKGIFFPLKVMMHQHYTMLWLCIKKLTFKS